MAVKNICDCDFPPGGQAVCEPHQIAVCAVINGIAHARCIDPPSGASELGLLNWSIGVINNVPRNLTVPVSAADIQMLMSSGYTVDNISIRFKLPELISNVLHDAMGQAQQYIIDDYTKYEM